MPPRTRLLLYLTAAFRSKDSQPSKDEQPISQVWAKFKARKRKPSFECQYCNELKPAKDFVNSVHLPWNCQTHLTGPHRVCKPCLEAALSAQLDCKPLLEVGCPQCGTPWEPEELHWVIGSRDAKRLRELDRVAQTQSFVPDELPDLPTMDDMLARGARLCPCCRFPFVKVGGCDNILCASCGRYFNVAYAPVLEDGKGRRAVEVGEDANADLW